MIPAKTHILPHTRPAADALLMGLSELSLQGQLSVLRLTGLLHRVETCWTPDYEQTVNNLLDYCGYTCLGELEEIEV